MLPDRSKRFASTENGDLPRLKLAENWQLGVIAFIMLGLFVVIFPRKALVEKLYMQHKLDELTLSYIDNLHRTEPDNADLTILLGRARHDQFDVAAMEGLLLPLLAASDVLHRREVQRLLLESYERGKQTAPADQAAVLQGKIIALLGTLRQEKELPATWARELAFSAFRAELPSLGLGFLRRALADAAHSPPDDQDGSASAVSSAMIIDVLITNARDALGHGRHALAAEYFLLAFSQTSERNKARDFFKEGIGALMAASLFEQALQAADLNIGDLADDPDTLRYLMRTALAAGDPQRAAIYARRLVFGEGLLGRSSLTGGGR